MIDVENEDLNSFLTKYNMRNFLKRMEEEEKRREYALEILRQQSTMRLLTMSKKESFVQTKSHKLTESESIFSHSGNDSTTSDLYSHPNMNGVAARPRAKPMESPSSHISSRFSPDLTFLPEELKLSDDYKLVTEEWRNQQGATHVMIVLQNIGSSVEVAHVTSHGGTRSFMRQFNAEKIAHTIYQRTLNNSNKKFERIDEEKEDHKYLDESRQRSDTTKSTQLVEALGRGPPAAYRCVVYRCNSSVVHARKFANEAANVAENLVKGGRVLGDPSIFAGSTERYTENPEKYFYRFLLNSDESLFRRTVRLHFDEGTNFLNYSSSEFVALCFQRALVNKKSFDRQLIRLLDFCPHLTPPTLLQKYLHLNIDEHGDWKCLGNIFFSYL
mmetsp:Transcript_23013/g.36697  ORF Transcript_23013/g.36697 Transcript_23013/m.36697 type:complete len:386 (+) Transcript_23013:3-1160(+)